MKRRDGVGGEEGKGGKGGERTINVLIFDKTRLIISKRERGGT